MQKWEYLFLTVDIDSYSDEYIVIIHPTVYRNYSPDGRTSTSDDVNPMIADVFMRLGAEGWELVAIDKGSCYFKRPVGN